MKLWLWGQSVWWLLTYILGEQWRTHFRTKQQSLIFKARGSNRQDKTEGKISQIKHEMKHKNTQKESLKHAKSKGRTLEQIILEHHLDLMCPFTHLQCVVNYAIFKELVEHFGKYIYLPNGQELDENIYLSVKLSMKLESRGH